MKTTRLLIVVALLSAIQGCTTSKRISVLPTLETLPNLAQTIDLDAYKQKYGDQGGVYLKINYTIEHSGGKGLATSWHFHKLQSHAYLVFDASEQALTTTRFSSRPDKLYMRMTLPSGEAHAYGLKDLQTDVDSEGDSTFTFVYPRVVSGTLIEEGFEYNSKAGGPIEHEIPLQFSVPCESLTVRYACPDWWQLQTKQIAPNKHVPLETSQDEEHHKQILTYTATDIPAIRHEAYAPYFREVASYLVLRVTYLNMGEHLQYKAPDSWRDLAREFNNTILPRAPRDEKPLLRRLDSMVLGATTRLDSVRKVAQYVHDEIALSPEGQRHDYYRILSDKSGSVFELTGLMDYLFYKLGIPSHLLLIHSAEDGYFDMNYVDVSQLYQPAVAVAVDSTTYFLFAHRDLPIGYIPAEYVGQQALQVDLGDEASFITLPNADPLSDLYSIQYQLTFDTTSLIQVEEVQHLEGRYGYMARRELRDLRGEALKAAVESYLTYTDGDVVLDTFYLEGFSEYDRPLLLHLRYQIDNLVTLAGPEVVFQTGGLFSPLSVQSRLPDRVERQNPIRIRFDHIYKKQITLAFPDTWQVVTPMTPVAITNPFGSVEVNYAQEKGLVRISEQVTLKRAWGDKDQVNLLRELIGTRAPWQIPTIIFATQES